MEWCCNPARAPGHFDWERIGCWFDAKGQSSISTQDYAVAMIDELERPAHIRQRYTVGY
jgi:putative NADH-flavin reductase